MYREGNCLFGLFFFFLFFFFFGVWFLLRGGVGVLYYFFVHKSLISQRLRGSAAVVEYL